jgi:hypothetical protein
MNGYIVSVLMGLAVGVAYGHVQVRSSRWSAYWTVDVARHHFVRPTCCGSSEPKLLQRGKRLSRRHDASRDLPLNARSVRLP